MNKVNVLLFGLCLVTTTVLANLNIIADLGGDDVSLYFEGINRQQGSASPLAAPPAPMFARETEAAMLPVITPELTPGKVAARSLQLPGIGALFIVGDDEFSRAWLQANAQQLKFRSAVGMVVNVRHLSGLQALRELVPGLPMAPASGTELACRLQLSHYPVLITDTGLSQQVAP